MDRGHLKEPSEKQTGAGKDSAAKTARDRTDVKFDKPLGSSHNDAADLRDVAQKAAKKSQ